MVYNVSNTLRVSMTKTLIIEAENKLVILVFTPDNTRDNSDYIQTHIVTAVISLSKSTSLE